MRRARSRIVTLLTGAIAAAALTAAPAHAAPPSSAPPSAPTATPGTEFTTGPALTPDGRVVNDAATRAAVLAFWTPERMKAATPARVPTRTDTAPGQAAPRTSGPQVVTQPVAPLGGSAIAPTSAVATGKAFFIDPLDGREHSCSAAVVSSSKGKLVSTAGHCVYSHDRFGFAIGWMRGWLFAPQYNNGPGPTGYWTTENLATRTAFITDNSIPTDIGMAITFSRIMYTVGGNGLFVNLPTSQEVLAIGYPAEFKYAGNLRQLSCSGRSNLFNPGLDLPGCDFTGGASGGPWMVDYSPGIGLGYVYSITSSIPCPFTPCAPTFILGVYLDDWMAGLYYYAEAIAL